MENFILKQAQLNLARFKHILHKYLSMRILYVAFFLLIGFTTQAQNIASLKYGSTLAINEVDIEFIKVSEDSRCPVKC